MFDWYRPLGQFECPVCRRPLHEWQGKDADCALLVWEQGVTQPVEQAVDDDLKGVPEVVEAARLPERFTIYSYDCDRHCVVASCRTVDGVWN